MLRSGYPSGGTPSISLIPPRRLWSRQDSEGLHRRHGPGPARGGESRFQCGPREGATAHSHLHRCRPRRHQSPDLLRRSHPFRFALEPVAPRAAQRRFLSQGFQAGLSRIAVIEGPGAQARVVLMGRLAVYGVGAARLHEEIIPVAAIWTEAPSQKTPDIGLTSIRVAKLGKRLPRPAPPTKSVIYAALGLRLEASAVLPTWSVHESG
jgi:hypothetical protein